MAATGDLLTHPPVLESARVRRTGRYDFRPLLRRLEPRIARADLALCHQELVLGRGPPQPGPNYLVPSSLARATADLGWDACSVASNHALDHGRRGIVSTRAALRRAGLPHSGVYATRRQSRRTTILRVAGTRIALLSYTRAINGYPPLPRPYSVNLIERRLILADARRARRHGAEAVIVNLHDTGDLVRPIPAYLHELARSLTKSRAITAIIGQGPHLVRPIRFVHGKPVIYSEGDLLSGTDHPGRSGLLAELEFVASRSRVRVASVGYLPLYVRPRDHAVLTVDSALRHSRADVESVRGAYREVTAAAGRSRRVKPVPRRLP